MALSQAGRILKLLQRDHSATNVQLNSLGIYRFSARIHELRKEGYIIESVRLHDGLWRFEYLGHRDDEEAA